MNTTKRAKSARRIAQHEKTQQSSINKPAEFTDTSTPVGKFNLSPEYQHVKAQYMDTSKTV